MRKYNKTLYVFSYARRINIVNFLCRANSTDSVVAYSIKVIVPSSGFIFKKVTVTITKGCLDYTTL